MEYVDLGRTGLRVSRLCIGTGTHGWGGRSQQTALGLEGLAALLRLGWEHGINFLDSADEYGSHAHIRQALQDIPRDQVVIMTKITSRRAGQARADVERFLRELDTGVLDVVLLHFVTRPNWPKQYAGAMEALSRAKERGQVRAVGLSSHNLGALREAAESALVNALAPRYPLQAAGAP